MNSSDIVKIIAIVSLAAIEIVNLLTLRVDGALLALIASMIGGIAGYEIGKKAGTPQS